MQPIRFGKYTLLDRLAVGGMAEVYRSKLSGEQGFEKLIVIKRMLPQIAARREMVAAFIDEARLAALLQHENIVYVYDFGELDGEYYMAMEYLFGKELRSIINQGPDGGTPIPLPLGLHVAARICDGLQYAHELKDLNQVPLNIIHRDVSPQNVFITYDGKVKLIDFGIAKATSQSERTRTGLIKGKITYMSPEQARGDAIDHRSDIFAAGILLYEMVTGSRMYQGADTIQIIEKVIGADFRPPQEIIPDLPAAVVRILDRALARNPDDRFSSCGEMTTAIEDCLFEFSLRPGAKALAAYMKAAFDRDFEHESLQIQHVLSQSEAIGYPPGAYDKAAPGFSELPTAGFDRNLHRASTWDLNPPPDPDAAAGADAADPAPPTPTAPLSAPTPPQTALRNLRAWLGSGRGAAAMLTAVLAAVLLGWGLSVDSNIPVARPGSPEVPAAAPAPVPVPAGPANAPEPDPPEAAPEDPRPESPARPAETEPASVVQSVGESKAAPGEARASGSRLDKALEGERALAHSSTTAPGQPAAGGPSSGSVAGPAASEAPPDSSPPRPDAPPPPTGPRRRRRTWPLRQRNLPVGQRRRRWRFGR
jgi:serine/threonine protein kinase